MRRARKLHLARLSFQFSLKQTKVSRAIRWDRMRRDGIGSRSQQEKIQEQTKAPRVKNQLRCAGALLGAGLVFGLSAT